MQCPTCGNMMNFIGQYQRWWCETCKLYGPPIPPQPVPAQRIDPARERTAKKLVNLSHLLGWGGLVFIFVGPLGAGLLLESGVAAGVAAVIGLVSAVAGAIVGQVGRGMQGRVI